MDDEDHIDWDAFAILAADPEIDAATAYAASIRDEPPASEEPPNNRQASLVIAAMIVGAAIVLFLMAM